MKMLTAGIVVEHFLNPFGLADVAKYQAGFHVARHCRNGLRSFRSSKGLLAYGIALTLSIILMGVDPRKPGAPGTGRSRKS